MHNNSGSRVAVVLKVLWWKVQEVLNEQQNIKMIEKNSFDKIMD